eukprot:Blabericola_migrator_1__479@NODE_1115_length_5385_cov_108_807634_g762_i0_p2_GENE_NODE_1115_length_5385_cov_108_807634_g762_i0NODE_1115_length_5385_cov_108_807634_g762_i0_p2_ORF_typecomplete_len312_score33_20Fboxlike/PF12937_7/0_00024Fboxlike/PF12937_7/1_6e03Fbox/PF00646_33/0_0042Fbox_5/PF18511_1/0_013_NODE_1115_length_5385_cov_108_807634_g762_i056991
MFYLPSTSINLILEFLTANDRFTLSQVCQSFREAVLSEIQERRAMMEYLKLSVLMERPWRYWPFKPLPMTDTNKLRQAMIGVAIQHLKAIKTWHCLNARSHRLAPWTVNVSVDTCMKDRGAEVDCMSLLPCTIGRIWERFLDSSKHKSELVNPRWLYIGVIGLMRSGRLDGSVSDFLELQNSTDVLEIEARGSSCQSAFIETAFGTLGPDFWRLSIDEFFSWDYATIRQAGRQQPDELALQIAQQEWLSEICRDYLMPQIMAMGFTPISAIDEKWIGDQDELQVGVSIAVDYNKQEIHLFGENHCCLRFRV